MAEMFSPTPEPEHDQSQPKLISDATKLTRTIAAILMSCWAWWWWNGYQDGAYWVIPAVFILATGETIPQYYKVFSPLWWPFKFTLEPLIFLVLKIWRLTIPEAYRRPQKVLKPLSFKEINEAIDVAIEEKRRKEKKNEP